MRKIFAVNRWSVFVAFTLAYFLSQFFRSANAVIATTLTGELSLSAAELGMMTSLFFATFAITQIPLGIALDRWGPRWVTAALMMVAVAGSLCFAFGSSLATLGLGRALLGIGLAGILMGGLKALSQWFPKERFASMTGLMISIGSLGGLVATTPMAWMNEQVGWRTIFVVGALLIAAGSLLILVGTRDRPPDAPPPTGERAKVYLPTILRSMIFWRIALPVLWIVGFGGAFSGLWAGPYLFDNYTLSAIETGNLLLLMGVCGIAGSAVAGWLADQIGIAKVVIIGFLITIVCQTLLAFLPPFPVVVALFITMGLAGGYIVALIAQARQLFPAQMTGQVLTMVNMVGFTGIFLLQWWIGEFLTRFPTVVEGHSSPQAYSTVLLIGAAISMVTLFWYLPLVRPQQNAQAAPTVAG